MMQEGERSVLYCTRNCSSIMEMHILKGWIASFVQPVVELCFPDTHLDETPCLCVHVMSVTARASARKLCVCECVQFIPYRYAANCQTGNCSFNSATKGSFPNVRSLQIRCFSSWMKHEVVQRQSVKKTGNTMKVLLTHVSRTTSRGVTKEWDPEKGGGSGGGGV